MQNTYEIKITFSTQNYQLNGHELEQTLGESEG